MLAEDRVLRFARASALPHHAAATRAPAAGHFRRGRREGRAPPAGEQVQRRLRAASREMAAGIGAACCRRGRRRSRCSSPKRRCWRRSPASRCIRACSRWARFRRMPTLAEVVARSPQPRLLAAADGLSSAENLGALVRNCAAFSAQALIVGETCSSPFLRRAVRSSMGTIFQMPIVETASLTQALRDLRERGIRCIAAHPHADGRTLSQANFTGDCCIVFGSEGYGISPAVLAACDEAAAIPMPPTVDSLNVGSAAAVFLYEANRQRGRM